MFWIFPNRADRIVFGYAIDDERPGYAVVICSEDIWTEIVKSLPLYSDVRLPWIMCG